MSPPPRSELRPSRVALSAAAAGGVPVAALLALAASGAARPGAALVAAFCTAAAALALALVRARDMDLLSDAVRQARQGPAPAAGLFATSPAAERLGQDIELLSREIAARSARFERVTRADEAIVERLPDPLVVLGANRLVRRANAAARAAYGADIQAVLRHPGLRGALDRAFERARGGTRPEGAVTESAELTLPAPVQRDVRATVIVLDPPLADGGEALVVLSDRTRERAVERTRADFVANASHELRTPLASLVGFIETIQGAARDDPPAQRRFLVIMADQAARMSRLIDDLLSLSRIELTEHQPPSESVDLTALLPRILDGFEPRVAARAITMRRQVAAGLPPVVGDAHQLGQVLQNLIDNAVKYGRHGGSVTVTLKPYEPAPSGAEQRWPTRPGVLLAVADDGIGIAREHLPRLTERFYRVDKGRARSVGGTGLGLAIVKHIVNRHRGQMVIESVEGAGVSVTIWLPQSVARAQPAPTGARPAQAEAV